MAIETNDTAPKPKAESAFAGATLGAAPEGRGNDFVSLLNQVGGPSVDPSVKPYLDSVTEGIREGGLSNVELVQLPRRKGFYAFRKPGEDGSEAFYGIMFTTLGDAAAVKDYHPASLRMKYFSEELAEMYPGKPIRIVGAEVIISGYAAEMAKTSEMAKAIIRTFNTTTKAAVKDATVSVVNTVEFSPDWNLAQAKAIAAELSPHAVLPRMDLAMVLRAKTITGNSREFRELETEMTPLGVIGGYIEILEKGPVMLNGQVTERYQPTFNITYANSYLPLEGVGAFLLAALASSVYNSLWFAKQWQDLSKDKPNPGMVDEDPERPGHPIVLQNTEELLNFIRARFAPIQIVYQGQDGRDGIPGFQRLFSDNPTEQKHLRERLAHFLEVDQQALEGIVPSRHLEYRFDGVYGDPSGALHDSRNIDFLKIAAQGGTGSITGDMRRTLLGVGVNPPERADLVSRFTGSFAPLYLNTLSLLNSDFLGRLNQIIASKGLVITDPNHQVEGRQFSSFSEGFGSGQGIPSIISNGAVQRGLNLTGFWNGR